jgi:hypothetical protein
MYYRFESFLFFDKLRKVGVKVRKYEIFKKIVNYINVLETKDQAGFASSHVT